MRLIILIAFMVNLMALELPSIIADGMVLQRDSQVPIWGWDAPGQEVQVLFRGNAVSATADENGRWQVLVPGGEAGGPFDLHIQGSTERIVTDILVGEVWIAGGQSNMWWALKNSKGGTEAIAQADDSHLRCYDPTVEWADTPQTTHSDSRWEQATDKAPQDWPGLPYFFGKRLRAALGVPVGLIHVAVPGKEIETFMPRDLLAEQFPQALSYYEQSQAEDWQGRWQRAVAEWEQNGKQGDKPAKPDLPQQPAGLWNGTVAACTPYAARGFIWWQGEANVRHTWLYQSLFPALITSWRDRFQVPPHAAFYYGELHGAWQQPTPTMTEAPWPRFREAQGAARQLPNVYPINANDLQDPEEKGWPNQIHPWHKDLAAERMLRRALVEVYDQKAEAWASPRISDYRLAGDHIVLEIEQAGTGLSVNDGEAATAFMLAGADRQWHPAQAELQGDRIILRSDAVAQPVAARHAWANYPQVNVVNSIGLPLATWRSDSW